MSDVLARVREMFPIMKADAVLVSDHANVRYISGYTNDTGVLLVTKEAAFLLTDFRFLFQAQEFRTVNALIRVRRGKIIRQDEIATWL